MKPRVLVVDDDSALAEMLGIVLRTDGFEPSFVADGARALAAFREIKPDIVLLDLMLPGLSGIDVCRPIRAESGVPIIMLTAKTDTVDVVLGLESGADDYVVKPFKPKELVARMRARLRQHDEVAGETLTIGPPDSPVSSTSRPTRSPATATADRADAAGVRPAGGAGPQAAPGVHPRGAAGAGLGLPARRRHPAGQRPRAAAALEGRARPRAARGRPDRPRRRVQGRSAVTPDVHRCRRRDDAGRARRPPRRARRWSRRAAALDRVRRRQRWTASTWRRSLQLRVAATTVAA